MTAIPPSRASAVALTVLYLVIGNPIANSTNVIGRTTGYATTTASAR